MKFGTQTFYKVDKEEDEQATALPVVYRMYSSQKTLDNIHLSLRKGLSLQSLQHLQLYLVHSRHSIFVKYMNETMNISQSKYSYKKKYAQTHMIKYKYQHPYYLESFPLPNCQCFILIFPLSNHCLHRKILLCKISFIFYPFKAHMCALIC